MLTRRAGALCTLCPLPSLQDKVERVLGGARGGDDRAQALAFAEVGGAWGRSGGGGGQKLFTPCFQQTRMPCQS